MPKFLSLVEEGRGEFNPKTFHSKDELATTLLCNKGDRRPYAKQLITDRVIYS